MKLNYKESTYYRLFRTFMLIVVSAVLLIGVIVVAVSTRIFRNNKLKSLEKSGKLYAKMLEDTYDYSGNIADITIQKLHFDFSSVIKTKVYIYNNDGECIFSAADYADEIVKENTIVPAGITASLEKDVKPLSKKVKSDIEGKKKKYLDVNSETYSSNEPMLVYGTKLTLSSKSSNKRERVYLVLTGKADDINYFMIKVMIMYVILGSATVYLAYFISKKKMMKYSQNEAEFLRVCEKYAKGDFSDKISGEYEGLSKDIAQYVNAMADDLENSEDASKTFIANVSHELRTPITTVGGFVQGILDGTIPKTKQTEYLSIVSKEIQRLKMLISSMLNMTKFESGTLRPNFRKINVNDLVIQTVLMFEKRIEEKNVEVEGLGADRMDIVIDADLMQQVIYNIVENAVKFINIGGRLTFSFEKADGFNCIGVKNTGEGLDDNEIKQVFDRFYKTDSSRGKDTTGLGLGLSISRKIVHLHNGHIVVKSIRGEYTEFIIQIPDIDLNKENTDQKQ